ncbi:uncharacterized protein B0H18DRAFT_1128177 [Fomitopsis serialis]|uniref:uncharacterized protein n=1 Tax=Fomitopsis serialis TaxID=139415 RepID=UPI0020082D90|nr:uncharacterized protein B0H18DRAFT_1128177 [Neoantrodia serialis]KAH9911760.1 hypothetical protein B0H18DRAFT_1128177 [Neoantrodia serialis]
MAIWEVPKVNGVEYRLPVYTIKDTLSTLPQEVIELIANFLSDEPVQLATCCLTCSAWYHAARPHLRQWKTIRSEEALRTLVRVLLTKRNERYGRALRSLEIWDNARKPFAHVFSLRVPGRLLVHLTALRLHGIDWSTVRPHPRFFKDLSGFASVIRLTLVKCRFRRPEELRAIANGLPNLKFFSLSLITVASAPPAADVIRKSPSISNLVLDKIQLFGSASAPQAYSVGSDDVQRLHQSVLDALASYSTVTSLQLDADQFLSFPQCQRFIRAFPRLQAIHMMRDPTWGPSSLPVDAGLLDSQTKPCAWDIMQLRMSSVSAKFTAQFLEAFASVFCRVVTLSIALKDEPTTSLLSVVRMLLRESGSTLHQVEWRCKVGMTGLPPNSPDPFAIPGPLTYNVNLTQLHVSFNVYPPASMSSFSLSLLAFFSQIESQCLQGIDIRVYVKRLPLPLMNTDTQSATAKFVTDFHAALSRGVFAGLPAGSVRVGFVLSTETDILPVGTVLSLVATIESSLVPCFTPWLCRGVVAIQLPDGTTIEDNPRDEVARSPPTTVHTIEDTDSDHAS